MATRVEVEELAQNLGRYLARVKAGETIEVTENGRLVATLAPRSERHSALTELERKGLTTTPATLDIRDLPPVPKRRSGQRPLSEVLAELRARERF